MAELASQQNVIAVVLDDSRSMAIADSDGKLTREAAAEKALEDGVLAGLQKKFQVRLYRLDSRVTRAATLREIQPTAPATHINDGVRQLVTETSDLPVGAVVFSPVTDMTLTGESWQTRAEADPYFTLGQGEFQVKEYLGEHSRVDPMASPLYADLKGLRPVRVQVGDSEVLLDDSVRYVEKAAAAGVDARLDLWMGLPHVFQSSVGGLAASGEALGLVEEFFQGRL